MKLAEVFLTVPLDTKAARWALPAGLSTDLVQATGTLTREAEMAAMATGGGLIGARDERDAVQIGSCF